MNCTIRHETNASPLWQSEPMSSRSQTRLLRTDRELGALGSVLRLELIERLDLLGPASVRELAEHLERSPSSLYHHVAILERAGLVAVRERRQVGKRLEAVYELVADRLRLVRRSAGPGSRSALANIGKALLRHAGRTYARSVTDPGTALEGAGRSALLRLLSLRLDDRGLQALNRDIDELVSKWSEQAPARGRSGYRLVLVLAPAHASRRAAPKRAARR